MTQPASDADALLSKFPGPATLYPSRKKWILVLLGCLVFAAGGAWMIAGGASWGWAALIFFGLGTAVSLAMLVPGVSALTLDRDGFDVTSLRRRHRTRWTDATGFEAVAIPPAMRRFVCYDDSNAARLAIAKTNVAMTGHNAALPDTYGLAPADLARLMSAWRERATATRRTA